MLYNHLDEADGWLFGPILQLRVNRVAALADQSFTATVGHGTGKQHVCSESTHFLNAIYIHQVHLVELLASPTCYSWNVEPSFVHRFEVDPDMEWDALIEASENESLRHLAS